MWLLDRGYDYEALAGVAKDQPHQWQGVFPLCTFGSVKDAILKLVCTTMYNLCNEHNRRCHLHINI